VVYNLLVIVDTVHINLYYRRIVTKNSENYKGTRWSACTPDKVVPTARGESGPKISQNINYTQRGTMEGP